MLNQKPPSVWFGYSCLQFFMFCVQILGNPVEAKLEKWKKKKRKKRKCWCFIFKVKVEPTVSIYSLNQTFPLFVLELGEYLKNVSRQVHHLDLFYDHRNIITAKSQTGFCQLVEEYILFPRNRRLPDCCRQVSMSVCNLRTYSLKPTWSPWMSNIQNGRQIDIMLIVVTCRQNLNGSLEQ